MKILIYGAGVLGSYLAHVLIRGGHNVTILARGSGLEELNTNGLVIRHFLQCKTTIDKVNTIQVLEQEDVYDLIFVVMQCTHLQSILPFLAQNGSKHIVFIGNQTNPQEIQKYIQENSSGQKMIAFGFQGTGGRRENGRIICVRTKGQMEIGGLNDALSWKSLIDSAFENTKYKLTYYDNMEAWFYSHMALILPLCYVSYLCREDLKKVSGDKKLIHSVIDAIDEGYKVLEALGYQILPENEVNLVRKKRKIFYWTLKIVTATPIGRLAISDHALSAFDEMSALDIAFNELKHKANLTTPNWNMLEKFLKKGFD